ncbi:MAG: hypothetical protein GXC94_07485 [Comamonadaceae bacterium]|nr:hypothetical protein [Comamonadaceae bacterium]
MPTSEMLMRSFVLALTVAAALAGCSRVEEAQPTDWSSLGLQGKTMDLIDDSKIESYRFSEQGLVAATFGTKGGAVAAPLFYWRVEGQALVISEAPGQQGVEELTTPKIQRDVVSAKRKSGASVQYRLAKSNV